MLDSNFAKKNNLTTLVFQAINPSGGMVTQNPSFWVSVTHPLTLLHIMLCLRFLTMATYFGFI